MAETIKIDEGQLARLERSVARLQQAEAASKKSQAQLNDVAAKVKESIQAGELLKRSINGVVAKLGPALRAASRVAAFFKDDDTANLLGAAGELTEDIVAGSRALGSIVPIVGAGAGAILGTALGSQRRTLREEGIRRATAQSNAAFDAGATDAQLKRQREAFEAGERTKKEQARADKEAADARSLGGGSAEAASALRRARGAR